MPSGTDIVSWLAVLSGIGAISVLRQAPDGIAALGRAARDGGGTLRSVCTGRSNGCAFRARSPKRPSARGAPSGRPPTLAVSDLVVHFGGVVAVDGVSFAVEPGEVVGLIGPNGAGKTTILDVITGFTAPSSGSVVFDGVAIDKWSVERRARAGIVRSWQAVELFEEMTVRENLLVAADDQSRAAIRHRPAAPRAAGAHTAHAGRRRGVRAGRRARRAAVLVAPRRRTPRRHRTRRS